MRPFAHTIVLVEDDADNLHSLCMLLEEEQYATLAATSLPQALTLLSNTTPDLVISDLFGDTPQERVHNAETMRDLAFPTPMGILTAHSLKRESPTLQTFGFALEKPYDINVLLTEVAACLHPPLSDDYAPQVHVVKEALAALSAEDCNGLMALCTDDVVYYSPYAGEIRGKAAYRSYAELRIRQFPQAQFTALNIYATPTGLAARYRATWHPAQGTEQSAVSGILFRFEGEQIAEIGNRFQQPSA